jgi:hypothetical protein
MALNWWMFDLSNFQLITTSIIPGDIKDVKDVVLSETPIPGQNYQPITYGGGGNKKISFTLPIMKRGGFDGNIGLLKQFENLRNRAGGLLEISPSQFTPNPKVLYNWGTGSVPLVYWVKKCDFSHPEGWTNQFSAPQYTLIDMELWLDEANPLNKAEAMVRKIASIANFVATSASNVSDLGSVFGRLL